MPWPLSDMAHCNVTHKYPKQLWITYHPVYQEQYYSTNTMLLHLSLLPTESPLGKLISQPTALLAGLSGELGRKLCEGVPGVLHTRQSAESECCFGVCQKEQSGKHLESRRNWGAVGSVLGHRHHLHCLHWQHSDSLQNGHLFSSAKPARVNSVCVWGLNFVFCSCITEFWTHCKYMFTKACPLKE